MYMENKKRCASPRNPRLVKHFCVAAEKFRRAVTLRKWHAEIVFKRQTTDSQVAMSRPADNTNTIPFFQAETEVIHLRFFKCRSCKINYYVTLQRKWLRD